MEAKFTPGPWKAHHCADTLTSQVVAPICNTEATGEIAWVGEIDFKGQHEANANLIAAAPEFYKKSEFKRNVIIHDNPDFEGEWIAVPHEDFDALRAVRAKARGET